MRKGNRYCGRRKEGEKVQREHKDKERVEKPRGDKRQEERKKTERKSEGKGDQRRRSKKSEEEEKGWKEREEGKEKGKCEAKLFQVIESDEEMVDKDVMGEVEGMVKIPQIPWDFRQRGAGRADR